MDIKQFKQDLFEKALTEGFKEVEIYVVTNETFKTKVFKQEVDLYQNSNEIGISFRGLYNDKMAYAFSEKLNSDTINFLIDEARSNALIIDNEDKEILYFDDKNIDNEYIELKDISVEEKIHLAKELENKAYEIDSRIVSVDFCQVLTNKKTIYLANSLGLEKSRQTDLATVVLGVKAIENEQTKVAYKYWFGNNWNDFNLNKLANDTVAEAINNLGAQSVESKEYPIILRSDMAATMLNVYESVFYADTVQKNLSLLKGKSNEVIASSIVTIRDDANCADSVSKVAFDSEGVECSNKVVVENGVLKTLLYNLKTAQKDKVKSTGNGFKAGYKNPVSTCTINFYIEKGERSLETMIKDLDVGIVITSLGGMHSGTSTISGDFSLAADGFLIENGKIVKAVEQITIAGNFFELLKDITEVGNDLEFLAPFHGSVGSPSLLIKKLAVSGL